MRCSLIAYKAKNYAYGSGIPLYLKSSVMNYLNSFHRVNGYFISFSVHRIANKNLMFLAILRTDAYFKVYLFKSSFYIKLSFLHAYSNDSQTKP